MMKISISTRAVIEGASYVEAKPAIIKEIKNITEYPKEKAPSK